MTIDLIPDIREVGISFECPRASLITGIENQLFDDLLIGNFMRTTLHNVHDLYPHFTPYVAKCADSGGAKTRRELITYFGYYYMRDPIAHSLKGLADGSEMVLRRVIPEDSAMFRLAKRTYYAYPARTKA